MNCACAKVFITVDNSESSFYNLSSSVQGKSERQLYGYELNCISLCREAFYSELWPSQVKTTKGKDITFFLFQVFLLYII